MNKHDKNLKVGDVIVGYYSGFHKITRIEKRFVTADDIQRYSSVYSQNKVGDEMNSLIYFVQIADAKGKPKKHKERCCDAIYCTLAKTFIANKIQEIQKTKEDLEKLAGSI